MIRKHFYLPQPLVNKLKRMAKKQGITTAELVRNTLAKLNDL